MSTHRLFDLPLGSWFRYVGKPATYVFLGHQDSGLVGDAPDRCRRITPDRLFQGLYSAAESRAEFEALMVEHVQAHEITELMTAVQLILSAFDVGLLPADFMNGLAEARLRAAVEKTLGTS